MWRLLRLLVVAPEGVWLRSEGDLSRMSAGSATVEGRREFRLFVGVQAGASNRRRIYLGIHKKYKKRKVFLQKYFLEYSR